MGELPNLKAQRNAKMRPRALTSKSFLPARRHDHPSRRRPAMRRAELAISLSNICIVFDLRQGSVLRSQS